MLAHLPSTLIPNPGMEGGDLMAEATQSDPDRLRLALDNGEEVELDGGTSSSAMRSRHRCCYA